MLVIRGCVNGGNQSKSYLNLEGGRECALRGTMEV